MCAQQLIPMVCIFKNGNYFSHLAAFHYKWSTARSKHDSRRT